MSKGSSWAGGRQRQAWSGGALLQGGMFFPKGREGGREGRGVPQGGGGGGGGLSAVGLQRAMRPIPE